MVLDAEVWDSSLSFEGVLRRNTLEWNGVALVVLLKYLLSGKMILSGLRWLCERYLIDDKQVLVGLLMPEKASPRMRLRYGHWHRVIGVLTRTNFLVWQNHLHDSQRTA